MVLGCLYTEEKGILRIKQEFCGYIVKKERKIPLNMTQLQSFGKITILHLKTLRPLAHAIKLSIWMYSVQ